MRHLVLSRELPPAAYPAGGIGTYVARMCRLLAEAGDVVHVIGQQWAGAPAAREEACDGRLIVHRVPLESPISGVLQLPTGDEIDLLGRSGVPAQAWVWNATLLAETLIEREGIDLVEAQEWEAPLYPLLLRRALGLGPARQPPCIVHLHSPTEFIWQHNEWDAGRPDFLPMRRQEEFCMAMADALLCPSHYLAKQVEAHYGLLPGRVKIIPYPGGELPAAGQDPLRARSGPVVYVGRLEPRKGLVEFIEAAVAVARDDLELRFHFVGSDVYYRSWYSVGEYLQSRIPAGMKGRFVFSGAVPRAQVADVLAGARLAVVPSRWENFPNTCIEAMNAAVPVLVSPTGGMVEMVEDGRTGWIAPSQDPVGLEEALRRALGTTPEQRQEMGRAAQRAIRQLCSDVSVTALQRAWRDEIHRVGSGRSLRLPEVLPWARAPMDGSTDRRCATTGGLQVASAQSARTAFAAMDERRPDLVLMVPEGFDSDPAFAEVAGRVLGHARDVGLVFGWMRGDTRSDPASCPAFPYQWLAHQGSSVFAIRAVALGEVTADALDGFHEPYATWALVNSMLAAGWKAVTVPCIAGAKTTGDDAAAFGRSLHAAAMRRRLRERHRALFSRDAVAVAELAEARAVVELPETRDSLGEPAPLVDPPDRWTGITMGDVRQMPLRDKFALALKAAGDPKRSVAWIRDRVRARMGGHR